MMSNTYLETTTVNPLGATTGSHFLSRAKSPSANVTAVAIGFSSTLLVIELTQPGGGCTIGSVVVLTIGRTWLVLEAVDGVNVD